MRRRATTARPADVVTATAQPKWSAMPTRTTRSSRSRVHLRQPEVDVAELVPAVALGEGGRVAGLQERSTGDGLHEKEVAGLRRVPAADDAVHELQTSLGCDDELGPPVALLG